MKKINKQKAINLTVVMTLLVTNIVLLFVPSTVAAPVTIEGVGWEDTTLEVEIGSTVTTQVWGNAQEFAGYTMWNLTFRWDPGIVNVSNVWNGDSDTWGSWSLTGGINNASGWVKQIDALTGDGSNVTGNYTLFNITFKGIAVGTTNLTFVPTLGQGGIVLLDDGGLPIDGDYRNASITVYPAQPATLTATRYNYTAINLSFTPGSGGNTTVIRGNTSSYPTTPTAGAIIYNGTLTQYNHTGLNPCETWYYSAWTYNISNGIFSDSYQTATAQTQCYTNFTFQGVVPANQTTLSNCSSYDVTVNLTINNSRGRQFYWYINGSDGSTTGGLAMANSSFDLVMSGLNHNQKYYWNVTASDATGTGDAHSANYEFTTGRGGGTAPGTPTSPVPTTGSTSIPTNWALFEVDVTDTDGDLLNVSFYWSNNTLIGTDTFVASGGTASITPTLSLDNATTYSWYVYSNDTCQQTRGPSSGYWTFTTDEPSVDITKDCTPSITNHSIRYIINVTNDGEKNYTDLVVNETFDSNVAFWKSSPARAGDYWWDIGYLNMSNSTSIVVWVNVTTCANGTTISNSVNVSNSTGTLIDTATCGPYTIAFSVSKEYNTSEVTWNTTHLNFTINVTNIGDIFLDGVLLNETYDNNISFYSANVVPYNTNQSFNLSDIAPGSTTTLYLRANTTFGLTGEILVNQSKVYNNVTVKTNQTTPEVTEQTYTTVGARTEALRISYRRDIPDLIDIGNSVFMVIGTILILITIFIIIHFFRKGGVLGEE